MTEVIFSRDTHAILIPDGDRVPVAEGVRGWLMQELGGHFTVQLTNGRLVRVDRADGDAIGREIEEEADPVADDPDAVVEESQVWAAMSQCYDPEIPQNIVALGLIYGVSIEVNEGEGTDVRVVMTLTAPGCGMGQVLVDDVRSAVRAIPGVRNVEVELTFEPPWSQDRMSEEAKLSLGYFF